MPSPPMLRFSTRVYLSLFAPLTLVGLLLGGYTVQRIGSDSHKRIDEKGETTAKLLAKISVNPLLTYDYWSLEEFITEVLTDKEVAFAVVRNERKEPVTKSGPKKESVDLREIEIHQARVLHNDREVGLVEVGLRPTAYRQAIRRDLAVFASVLVGVLALGLLLAMAVSRAVTIPVARLCRAAEQIAAGDLEVSIDVGSHDELGGLARSFEKMARALQSVIADLEATAVQIRERADRIYRSANEQLAEASRQAQAFARTSESARAIAANARYAANYADSVIEVASQSELKSREGQSVVESNIEEIVRLKEQVEQIAARITALAEGSVKVAGIIETVKEMAEQSNVLSLNAAIEAARAGEQGLGFAVVAQEMRRLAELSAGAADEVRRLLSESIKGTGDAVAATRAGSARAEQVTTLARDAGTTIGSLAEAIRDSAGAARQIAERSRQQTSAIENVVATIQQLSTQMSSRVADAHQLEEVAQGLQRLSSHLNESIQAYRPQSNGQENLEAPGPREPR